jgi:hypothetical protein
MIYINKKIKYIISLLLLAVLAYTLFFIFILLYEQPRGFQDYFSAYFYGFYLHLPWWILGLVFFFFFDQDYLKSKTSSLLLLVSSFLLTLIFLFPFLYNDFKVYFDYIYFPFLIVDFLLCFLLLNKFFLNIRNAK